MRWVTVLSLLLLAACGYHFPGSKQSLPGGVEKLYIPLFVNQTAEPRLEVLLSSAVSEVFVRRQNISQVSDPALAEATLEVKILAYESRALSYNQQDDISEYRSTIRAAANLRQLSDGRTLWRGEVAWSADYPAADDKSRQEDLEQGAIEEISQRLAEELLYRLRDGF